MDQIQSHLIRQEPIVLTCNHCRCRKPHTPIEHVSHLVDFSFIDTDTGGGVYRDGDGDGDGGVYDFAYNPLTLYLYDN